MPKINLDGINVAYEVAGSGPTIVFTPGGAGPRNAFTYCFAGRFSKEYSVLTWDRPNDGQSDLAILECESEWHMWTDCLHALLQELRLAPAYIGGGSGGCMTSLLMAARYPDDVKGLILQDPPTDDIEGVFRQIAQSRYLDLASAAKDNGLNGAVDASKGGGWAIRLFKYVDEDPEWRSRLEAIGADKFIAIMERWADWCSGPRANVAGVSEEDLRNLSIPAIVSHGFDSLHPHRTAWDLFQHLPNAMWAEYSDRYTAAEIETMSNFINSDDIPWSTFGSFVAPFQEEFLNQVESGTFTP